MQPAEEYPGYPYLLLCKDMQPAEEYPPLLLELPYLLLCDEMQPAERSPRPKSFPLVWGYVRCLRLNVDPLSRFASDGLRTRERGDDLRGAGGGTR